MAGQLTIDTLKASSGVLATQNGMTGIAKAWVNFVGSTGTINQAFNVSSVTRNGTGDYTLNFTTAMANTTYCACIGSNRATGSYNWSTINEEGTRTTSAFQVKANQNGTLIDVAVANISIFGA